MSTALEFSIRIFVFNFVQVGSFAPLFSQSYLMYSDHVTMSLDARERFSARSRKVQPKNRLTQSESKSLIQSDGSIERVTREDSDRQAGRNC